RAATAAATTATIIMVKTMMAMTLTELIEAETPLETVGVVAVAAAAHRVSLAGGASRRPWPVRTVQGAAVAQEAKLGTRTATAILITARVMVMVTTTAAAAVAVMAETLPRLLVSGDPR
ncbi:unnamed protein product, partial [Laminaria digitata]